MMNYIIHIKAAEVKIINNEGHIFVKQQKINIQAYQKYYIYLFNFILLILNVAFSLLSLQIYKPVDAGDDEASNISELLSTTPILAQQVQSNSTFVLGCMILILVFFLLPYIISIMTYRKEIIRDTVRTYEIFSTFFPSFCINIVMAIIYTYTNHSITNKVIFIIGIIGFVLNILTSHYTMKHPVKVYWIMLGVSIFFVLALLDTKKCYIPVLFGLIIV